MNHRPRLLLALPTALVLGWLAGCVQPCWQPECDWKHAYQQAQLPPRLESDPDPLLRPLVPEMADPATVLDPERNPYYLSLQEAIAIALEHGTTGSQSVRVPGVPIEDLVSFGGGGVVGSDSIRVLAFQPARVGTGIEASLARFDPLWSTGINWTTTDEPLQGLESFSNGQSATFSSTLAKPLATGGVAGVSFTTTYLNLSQPPTGEFGVLNPSYTPRLLVGFEQPLLRGYGVGINQLLPSLPGSSLFPALNGRPASGFGQGLVVARLRFDQQRAELERAVNYLLLNVEAAYWNLYGAYVNLYVTEQGLRQSHMTWVISKQQLELGKFDPERFAQIEGQYEQFRGDRIRALGNVLTNERNLRVLLGLPVEDGRRLVPIDAPATAPANPSWKDALRDTLELRPELLLAREDVKARHYNLLIQKNFLLPDLRFQATHTTVGLGTRLDGGASFIDPDTGQVLPRNALRTLTSAHFNDWTMGLTLNMPIGFRFEHAQARDARLALAQSYALLRNQEQKAITFLARRYSTLIEAYKTIEIRRQQRLAQADQLEKRLLKFIGGKESAPEFLLNAQLQWAQALSQEYQAIVDYNIALATFEFARGTIQRYDNVSITEGPLPECAVVRAVDHERQRTREAVVGERARLSLLGGRGDRSPVPTWPAHGAPTVVALQHDLQTPPPAPEAVPPAGPETEPGPAPRPTRATLAEPVPSQAPPPEPPRRLQFGTPAALP